jgi:HAD superfamily hydrolase (TIGR01509 family)
MNQHTAHLSGQAIIFDLDGLMADSEPLAEWSWNQVLTRYGHQMDQQTFRDVLGMRVADSSRFICERFRLPISAEEAMAERDQLFLEAVPTRLQARPGLYSLLDELVARDLPLGVATSGHRRYVTLALQTLGLESRFQAIARGDEVERGKPAPDVFLLAAERLGISPDSCLALEDAPLGVESAVTAGMVCLAVPNERTPPPHFSSAYCIFPSLNEVREALGDLLNVQYVRYTAAGGVVVHDDRVLVLRRPSLRQMRLPKGHIEPGESAQETALRETREESGYAELILKTDLGTQVVRFAHAERQVVRTERYFLMTLVDPAFEPAQPAEEQFESIWLTWNEALAALTFEAEKEWVRRAQFALSNGNETTTERKL